MQQDTILRKWNDYKTRLSQDYPDLSEEELHGTEGWFEKMALLLQEKYGITYDEAMEKTKEIAEEVDYDENAVNEDKIRSFHLDTNSDHSGKMTDIL